MTSAARLSKVVNDEPKGDSKVRDGTALGATRESKYFIMASRPKRSRPNRGRRSGEVQIGRHGYQYRPELVGRRGQSDGGLESFHAARSHDVFTYGARLRDQVEGKNERRGKVGRGGGGRREGETGRRWEAEKVGS